MTVSGTTYDVTDTDTGIGTINDDDVQPPPPPDSATLTINDASAEEGNDITFTITLDNAIAGGFTITPNYTDGTATEGTDYTANTNAITFTGTAGETQTLAVSTIEDGIVESNETFTVSLTVSGTTHIVTATDTGIGTITNDDVQPPPPPDSATLTINDASAEEGNDITFTITLDNAIAGGFTITPNYTDGTATEGTDYTANTNAITFTGTAGETQTLAVSTIEDGIVESNETFTVGLTVSGTTHTVTATDTGTGTINDDDVQPTVTVNRATLTINDASASEGDSMTFTITLDNAIAGGFTVTPNYTDGTATEGTDYTANTNAITFTGTAGETQTLAVSTIEDGIVESNETFTVGLTVSGTTHIVTATDTGTGTITNDDVRPTVTVNSPTEDQTGAFEITIAFSKSVVGFVQSDISVGNGSVTAFSGSGTSYTATTTPTASGTVTINVPENAATDDAGNGNIAAEESSVQVDLEPPSVVITGSSGIQSGVGKLITAENGQTDHFKVMLDKKPIANINLAINSSDLTEGTVTPETITFTSENWNVLQPVTITGQDDDIDDGDQDYRIVLTPTSDAYDDLDAVSLGVVNRDDDTAGITITSISGLVRQPQGIVSLKRAVDTVLDHTSQLITSEAGHTVSFAVVLDTEPTASVTLAIKCSDLTEGALSTETLTFIHYNPNQPVTDGDNQKTATHWHTPQMVTVTGLPDNLIDGMQSYNVTVTPVSGDDPIYNALGPKQVPLVNLDNIALIDLTLSQGTLTPIFDSETTAYTATVDNAVESLTVTPTASDSTATITVNSMPTQSGTPSGAIALDIGANTIEVIVTSTIYTVVSTKTYTVTVTREANNPPDAPVLQDQTTMVGEAFHYAFAEVNDPDPGQIITYTATRQGGGTLPGWLHFDGATRTFSGTPTRADVGTVSIAVTATDNGIPPMAASTAFTLTVEPPDVNSRALKLALASFGRTVASNAVDVLESRFTSPRSDGVMLGGQSLNTREGGNRVFGLLYGIAQSAGLSINIPTSPDAFNATGDMPGSLSNMPGQGTPGALSASDAHLFTPVQFHRRSMRDILSQSSFDMRLGQDDTGKPSPWALWGQGNASGFSGSEDNISLNGRVFSAFLGVDHHLKNNMTLGLALSHSAGEIDYNAPDGDAGTIDLTLNSLIPYAHYAAHTGLDIWGMGSAGWGKADVKDQFHEVQTDISMMMGALGMQNPVAQMGDIALSVKGDAFILGIGSDAREKLTLTKADVQRVRFALQGETDHAMSETSLLTPRLELGGRWDGGSADTGVGAEIGGGLAYLHTPSGWGLEARGRYLFAHQDADFEDWGTSLNLRFDPGSRSRGLWLTVVPQWGQPNSQANALWDNAQMLNMAMGNSGSGIGLQPHHLDMEIGYGLPIKTGLFTSYSGMSKSMGAMHYRLGSRLEIGQSLHINLEGNHAVGMSGPRFTLQGQIFW